MRKLKGDFKNQQLTKKDLSNSDIRGLRLNFLNLKSSNFSYTINGVSLWIKYGIIFACLVFLTVSGVLIGWSSFAIGDELFLPGNKLAVGIVTLLIPLIFLGLCIYIEFKNSLASFTLAIFSFLVFAVAVSPPSEKIREFTMPLLFGVLIDIGFIAGFTILTETIVTLGIIIVKVSKLRLLSISLFFALAGAIPSTVLNRIYDPIFKDSFGSFLVSFILTIFSIVMALYFSLKAMNGERKYLVFKSFAIALCSKKGTNFYGSDLTDADFTEALLGNTDFREANLTRTCWLNAKNLDKARVEGTYLENEKIRQLVVTGDGRNQNFDGLDLRGCNLRNADLTDASFINAKLSEATLEGANLTRAKLAKAQLYGTNLKNAILTGACIQDWAISLDTQFEGIKCEYVYMRLETKEDPDPWRKPDNRNETFKDGDFSDFIAPIIKTQKLYQTQNIDLRRVAENYTILDIFHHQGVDPSAAAIAFQKLIEKYPEAGLKVLSIEGRGNEKIHFQAQVTDDANRSILSQEYSAIYNQIKSGTYSDLQAFLAAVAEKDQQIVRFQELLENAIQQPKFYVETYQETRGNITISSVQGNISGVVGGDLTGTVDVSQGDTEISGDRNIEINKGDYRETSVNDQGSYIEGNVQNSSEPEES
ncbi:pentapeptide repeat protein [Planktothrix agardhii CCAP 1459/11A]|uniref:Pentapeptide repeat protein n=3 Tax=Microcoleaceae TaxID=1892252 RepID=A0A4P5ZHY1_PLAAG|nr:pentapeptide repeat protein [Planktothrix agardhii CCAP 1459/11A]